MSHKTSETTWVTKARKPHYCGENFVLDIQQKQVSPKTDYKLLGGKKRGSFAFAF